VYADGPVGVSRVSQSSKRGGPEPQPGGSHGTVEYNQDWPNGVELPSSLQGEMQVGTGAGLRLLLYCRMVLTQSSRVTYWMRSKGRDPLPAFVLNALYTASGHACVTVHSARVVDTVKL